MKSDDRKLIVELALVEFISKAESVFRSANSIRHTFKSVNQFQLFTACYKNQCKTNANHENRSTVTIIKYFIAYRRH